MTVLVAEPGRLAYAQAYAEQRLGRPLTAAERRVDLVHADRVLARGKERLRAAIQREVRRVVEERFRGLAARMELTAEMVHTLLWLNNEGRKAAMHELRQMGIRPRGIRTYASPSIPPKVEGLAVRTRSLMGSVQLRVEAETRTELGMAGLVSTALAARLAETIPGALDAASRLVSSGFIGGTGDVFSEHADLFDGFEISAVMDDATCDACEANDGDTFATLEEAATVMEDGWGPNMDCYGDGRCRCRTLPIGSGGEDAGLAGTTPLDEGGAVGETVGATAPVVEYPALIAPDAAEMRALSKVAGDPDIRDLGIGPYRRTGSELEAERAQEWLTNDLIAGTETPLDAINTREVEAKQTVMRNVADRLRGNEAFERSIYPRFEQKIGDTVRLPGQGDFRIVSEVGDVSSVSGGQWLLRNEAGDEILTLKERVARETGTVIPKLPGTFTTEFSTDQMENAVAELISNWSSTSADDHPWAIAMQDAIREEFGLSAKTTEHFELSSATQAEAAKITAAHGDALRAFVRAMYDDTQAQLAADGIKEFVLYRGSALPRELVERTGEQFRAESIWLQPGSSFSASYEVAYRFSGRPGAVMGVRVPASRILGSARTGYGCLREQEFVVLGQREVADQIPARFLSDTAIKGWDSVAGTDAQFWRVHADAAVGVNETIPPMEFLSEEKALGDLRVGDLFTSERHAPGDVFQVTKGAEHGKPLSSGRAKLVRSRNFPEDVGKVEIDIRSGDRVLAEPKPPPSESLQTRTLAPDLRVGQFFRETDWQASVWRVSEIIKSEHGGIQATLVSDKYSVYGPGAVGRSQWFPPDRTLLA